MWVEDPANAERARALIEAYMRAGVPTAVVRCPKCGEDNPATFDLCWKCGTGLERSTPA